MVIRIYTDASVQQKDGLYLGGWGYVLLIDGIQHEVWGSVKGKTIDTVELQTIGLALCNPFIHDDTYPIFRPIIVYSDSKYCVDTLSPSGKAMRDRGYRTMSGALAANVELIKEIFEIIENYPNDIVFKWIKGHVRKKYRTENHELNELADRLANQGREALTK